MESTQQIQNINRCATRISDESGKVLYGSGILYLASIDQYAFIFTAAHVIDNMKIQNDNTKRFKLALKDGEDNVRSIDLECKIGSCDKKNIEIGDIYIHSKYNNLENDVAIICINREDWMSDLKPYSINNCNLQDEQIGYGFPGSSDNETTKEKNTILDGKSNLVCDVVDIREYRYVFDYTKKVHDSEISRDQIMKGFSGTGLFSFKNERYSLCGIVSSAFGNENAGSQAYASNANLLLDIMEQHDIKMEIPKTFNLYCEQICQEFSIGFDEEKDIFYDFVDDLTNTGGLIPENVYEDGYEKINCNQLKISCDDYWKGQLKKAVIFAKLKSVAIEDMKCPSIKMPEPYNNCEVSIKFICTDEKLVTVVSKLVESDYFGNGQINNNTIILWNNHHDNKEDITEYSRGRFRKVMTSIVGEKRSKYPRKIMENKLLNLLDRNIIHSTFDIISGDIQRCNLALLGTKRMFEVIEFNDSEDYIDYMKNKFDIQLKRLWEE